MSCGRMENRILPYVDRRLKEGERLEMEKHLAACAACQLRVNEFRAVTGLLDELPAIEPSEAFDLRVHARVAAEPAKQSWWAWFTPSPRVAFAASMLLVFTVWMGSLPTEKDTYQHLSANVISSESPDEKDLPVLENYDLLSNFEPLTELPQPVQADEATQQNQQM